jgi:hypothetical protein
MKRAIFASALQLPATFMGAATVEAQSLPAGWYQLHVGAGGAEQGLTIMPDGSMAAWGNEYEADIWNPTCANPGNAPGVTGCWVSTVTWPSFPSSYWNPHYVSVPSASWMEFAPSNTQDMYNMVSSGCLFFSSNKGATWAKEAHFPCVGAPGNGGGFMFKFIAADPQNPDDVFVATSNNGYYHSTNGTHPATATWTQVSTSQVPISGGGAASSGNIVAFNPKSAVSGGLQQGLWFGSYGHGVYYSEDNGATVALLPGSPINPQKFRVGPNGNVWVISDASPNAVFQCSTSSCAEKSSWPSAPNYLIDFSIDPTNMKHIVLLDADAGIYAYSRDFGSTWHTTPTATVSASASDVTWLAKDTTDVGTYAQLGGGTSDGMFDPSGNYWITTGIGVYESLAANVNSNIWQTRAATNEELVPTNMISPPNGCTLNIFWDKNVFKTCTNFATHTGDYPTSHGIDYTHSIEAGTGVDYASSQPSFIVDVAFSNIGQGNSQGYSTDGGSTWSRFVGVPSELGGTYNAGAIAAATSMNFVWVLKNCGDVFYTTNGGAMWQQSSFAGLSAHDCGFMPSWGEPTGRTPIGADRVNFGVYYAVNSGSTAPGIYKSINSGANFTLMRAGPITANDGSQNLVLRMNPITAGQFLVSDATGSDGPHLCKDSQPSTLAGAITCTQLAGTSWNYGADWGAAKNVGQAAIFFYGRYNSSYGAFVSYDGWSTVQQVGHWGLSGTNPPAPLGVHGGPINFPLFVAGDNNHVGVMYLCWTPGAAFGCSFYWPG